VRQFFKPKKTALFKTQAMSMIDSAAVEQSRQTDAETSYRDSNTAKDPYAQRTFPDSSPFPSGK